MDLMQKSQEFIEQNWRHVKIPNKNQLFAPGVMSDYSICVLYRYCGHSWNNVDRNMLYEYYDMLYGLSHIGFNAVLPSFLMMGLDAKAKHLDGMWFDTLEFMLQDHRDHFEEKIFCRIKEIIEYIELRRSLFRLCEPDSEN
jgi:hypothetical protein